MERRRGFAERESLLGRLHSPTFDLIRDDPRFDELVRRVGIPDH